MCKHLVTEHAQRPALQHIGRDGHLHPRTRDVHQDNVIPSTLDADFRQLDNLFRLHGPNVYVPALICPIVCAYHQILIVKINFTDGLRCPIVHLSQHTADGDEMSTPCQGLITPHQQLTALLAAAQRIAQQMADSGVWDELIWATCDSIDKAVMECEACYALTSDERAVRARDDADSWRFEQRREERHAA